MSEIDGVLLGDRGGRTGEIEDQIDDGVKLINYEVNWYEVEEDDVDPADEAKYIDPFLAIDSQNGLLNCLFFRFWMQNIYSACNEGDHCRQADDQSAAEDSFIFEEYGET